MPDVDLNDLARDLVKATANLGRHIEAEGLRIGAQLGKSHALAAQDQIAAKNAELRDVAFELQRANDCIAELRRQLEVQARMASEAKARLDNVRLLKVWHDDLGRGYVFADELAHAFDPDTYPAPFPARLDKEN